MLIGTIVCPMIVNAQSNKIAVSDVPAFVAEVNKKFPMKIDEATTLSQINLINQGKQVEIVISMNPIKKGVTVTEFTKALKSLSSQQIRNVLGANFKVMTEMFPVPVSLNWVFPDGTSVRTTY